MKMKTKKIIKLSINGVGMLLLTGGFLGGSTGAILLIVGAMLIGGSNFVSETPGVEQTYSQSPPINQPPLQVPVPDPLDIPPVPPQNYAPPQQPVVQPQPVNVQQPTPPPVAETKDDFICPKCNKEFPDEKKLKRHYGMAHYADLELKA